jgi:hypothetical protein
LRKLFCSILVLQSLHAYAQLNDLGTWNILNLKLNITDKWSLFGEGQIRSLKFYNNFHYFEYKGGVNFKAHKLIMLSLGAGSYQTFKEGGNFVTPKNNNEIRIWPQVVLSHSFKNFSIEHRYRAEFRFTLNGYRNRFRYRLGFSYKFGKDKKGFKPFKVTINNEIFLTDKLPFFERNRVAGSFFYSPLKELTLQLGYIHQFDNRLNDEIGRSFLQLGIYYEYSIKKKNSSKLESTKN